MNAGGQIRYVYTWCGPQVGNKCFRLPNLDSKMPRAPHQLSEAYMTIRILKPNYHANLTHACYLDAMFLTLRHLPKSLKTAMCRALLRLFRTDIAKA